MHEQLVSRRAKQGRDMTIQNIIATMARNGITIEDIIDYVAAEACTRTEFVIHTTRQVEAKVSVTPDKRKEAAPDPEAAPKRIGVRQL